MRRRALHDEYWHEAMEQAVMQEREAGFDCTENKRVIMRAFDRLPKQCRDKINELGPEAPEHINDMWMGLM